MKSTPSNIRIVIDANVFISAIVFGGNPRKVIDLISEDLVTLVMAEEILTEVKRIIVSKFPEFLADLEKVEKLVESYADLVKLGTITVSASRDHDDNKYPIR